MANARDDLDRFWSVFGDSVYSLEVDCLLVALQRTGSTSLTRGICDVKGLDIVELDKYYPYRLSKCESFDLARLDFNGFYLFNLLNFAVPMVDALSCRFFLWGRFDLFLLFYLLRKAKRVIVLRRRDSLRRALSCYYQQFVKEVGTVNYFERLQKVIDNSGPVNLDVLNDMVYHTVANNDLVDEVIKRYGDDRFLVVEHVDLFTDPLDDVWMNIAEHFRLGSHLERFGYKMTPVSKVKNIEEIKDFYGRGLTERVYWTPDVDIGYARSYGRVLAGLYSYMDLADQI